ncbi:MAG: hypothetical protein LBJ96_04765, partial [Holosporaceae bacterium]|nr:hypothetical protein [Holosporaceae bacterium]
MFKILLKKATWIAFLQKNKEIAKECCEEISEFILSVPEKYMVHIRNACIILICYVIASFFTYPEFKIDVFFKEIFSLLCTYGAVFLYFGDKIDNEVPFRISVAVTAFVAPVLFINNPFGVAFLSLALIVFCEFLVFEYYRGCRLFSDLIPVYVICENEADAERASEFFDDYKVLELVVLSGKNCYGSLNSAEDTEKWLKKITRMPFYPSPRRLLYFSETPNEDTFFKLMKLAANFAIPLFKAVKNASSSNTLSIAPVSLGDIESNEVALDKATLNASFKGKRVWICYDGRGSVLDLICAISFVNSVDITVYCESERLMFEADQELSERCPNKNYKIKIVDM